jgi:hypothetical protein
MEQANPLAKAANDPLRLYSVKELAELWNCTDMHIYKLIETGELPTVNIANPNATGIRRSKTRIRATDAEAYVTRKTRAAK